MNKDKEQKEIAPEPEGDLDNATLQKLLAMDNVSGLQALLGSIGGGAKSTLTKTFIVVMIVGVLLLGGVMLGAVRAIHVISASYAASMDNVIRSKQEIDTTNNWERLPPNQKTERLRTQWYDIIRYYTNNVPATQKMNDDQIQATFNTYNTAMNRVSSVNFFIPLAYMKVATNFNPVFSTDYRRGIAALAFKQASDVANLPLVKTDPALMTVFKGMETLSNPSESMKLLVAQVDDLMTTFNGRYDWVFFALFTNTYDVMARYWDSGNGKIPDAIYKSGPTADAIKYYMAFKNWQIPSVSDKQ